MKRLIGLILVFTFLLPIVATAQDDLSETYRTNGLIFKYPTGWVAYEGDSGEIYLSNTSSGAEERLTGEVEAGEVRVVLGQVSALFARYGDLEVLEITETDPKFTFGFFSATVWFATRMLEPGTELQVGAIEEIDLHGRPTYLVNLRVVSDNGGFESMLLSTGDGLFIWPTAAAGEMEQWRSTILDIAASMELVERG